MVINENIGCTSCCYRVTQWQMTSPHFCCGGKLLKFPAFHQWVRVECHRMDSDRRPAWGWSDELCCLLQPCSDQRETSVCMEEEAGAEEELELEQELSVCPHAAPDHSLFLRDGGDRLCPQKEESCKKAHHVPPVMPAPAPMAEVLTAPSWPDPWGSGLLSATRAQPAWCLRAVFLSLLVRSRAPQGSLTEPRVTQLGASPPCSTDQEWDAGSPGALWPFWGANISFKVSPRAIWRGASISLTETVSSECNYRIKGMFWGWTHSL